MKTLQVRIRIDFSPSCALGPGKVALLEEMLHTGSLAEAARQLGMAYRTAWLLLQNLNGLLDEPVAVATRGGAGGGGVELSSTGKALISAYRHLERDVIRQARSEFGRFTLASSSSGAAPMTVKRLSRRRKTRASP